MVHMARGRWKYAAAGGSPAQSSLVFHSDTESLGSSSFYFIPCFVAGSRFQGHFLLAVKAFSGVSLSFTNIAWRPGPSAAGLLVALP